MAVVSPPLAPSVDARAHLERLGAALGLAPSFVDRVAPRPDWPVWPQPALSWLVGPKARVLANLDLRWLHRLEASVDVLGALSASVGGPAGGPTGLSLLVERAALLGHHGWGTWSAGTSCRMIRVEDGWLAVNLPREEDLDAVPAWLECAPGPDSWSLVTATAPYRRVDPLLERAALLGMAVAAVPEPLAPDQPAPVPTAAAFRVDPGGAWRGSGKAPVVVDLSSLWAGPLCGWYLARARATVLKVESTRRPDGARLGTPPFYRRLNANKTLVELPLDTVEGVAELSDLIDRADIVIEASRPRVLQGWGIDAQAQVDAGTIWCSITGHGRGGPSADRVAFGDDAAVAGGLVTHVHGEPWFIGDAAADPIAGASAAAGVLGLWASGVAGLVDVAMSGAVASLTGGTAVRSEPGFDRQSGAPGG